MGRNKGHVERYHKNNVFSNLKYVFIIGGQYYREYLERMRRQRREQMNRRHFETFHQPRYFEMQQDHRDAAVKYARLKLEWSFDTDISISMLKERILADSIFSTGSGTEKSAVASFK